MKKIISLALALIMVLGMMPALGIEAYAFLAKTEVFGGFDSTGNLTSISVLVHKDDSERPVNPVPAYLVLSTRYFDNDDQYLGYYREFGTIADEDFANIGEAVAHDSNEYEIVTYTNTSTTIYGTDQTLTFNVDGSSLEADKLYYVYLWVEYTDSFGDSKVYPDFLIAAVKKEGNIVKHAPVNAGSRYEYGSFVEIQSQDSTVEYTFGYAYDCQRSPDYPRKGKSTRLYSFDEPMKRDHSKFSSNAGNWKLSVCTETPSDSKSYLQDIITDLKTDYGMTEDPTLYKLTNGDELVAYGVVLAATEDKVFFVGDLWNSNGAGFLLSKTEVTESEIYITPTADATDEDIAAPAPTPTTYTITKGAATNGTFEVDKTSAAENDVVTITATPDTANGYILDKITVTKTGDANTTVAVSADGKFTMPDYDVTVTVTFKLKTYTVKYYVDGNVASTQTVEHGKDATAPTIPAKTGYDQTAPYWDNNGTNITCDTDITAVYTINKYTVRFIAVGRVVDTQTVEYGADAVIPEVPARRGYKDGEWNSDGKNITSNTDITAKYVKIPETVTVVIDGTQPERNEEVEENPNTGAPVMFPAVLVIAAAGIVLGKNK